MKAKAILTTKGREIFFIIVKENKDCLFNFGTNDWFTLEDFGNLHKHPNPKIKRHASTPKFKKDYKKTLEVVESSEDYLEIIQKFIKDFKKDRGIKIKEFDLEVDENRKDFKFD